MPLRSEKLFEYMVPHLEKNGAQYVEKLNAVYQFRIFAKRGDKPRIWTVDLKSGSGSISEGEVKN